jgi:outer membrane protein OmpA-like peptidoglycan-associated protein
MIRLVLSAVALLLFGSCAKAAPQAPQTPARDVVALAADPETGDVGRLSVTTPRGQVELAARNASTTVVGGAAPAPATLMSDAEIERLFGAVMRGQAPPALRYLLYFELGSDTLTPESKVEVLAVVDAVRNRVAPDVSVIGHTDTIGPRPRNAALGLERASLIRDHLLETGLDRSLVEVASHGESDLLVPTADNVVEARNRRVEVIVR